MTTTSIDDAIAGARAGVGDRGPAQPGKRAVRNWLIFVSCLIFVMVVVGGATRLTGSGLSITEWKPITGAIPPLSHGAWMAEFDLYRATPQYRLLNAGMSLGEFQFIYLWEWGHRQLGRFIGLAYMLPLLWFAVRGAVRGRLLVTLAVIGLLGGLQGAIGWIMVHSGLQPGMTAVAPVKLMLHLLAACILLACVVAVIVRLSPRAEARSTGRVRWLAGLLVAGSFAQIGLGALVAGLHAGLTYNTWPLMDGRFIPDAATLAPLDPWWMNMLATVPAVQFNHRMGAYILLALAIFHAVDVRRLAAAGRASAGAAHRAIALAGVIAVQGVIGVATLLLAVPIWAGLLHQACALAVLVTAVIHARRLGAARSGGAAATLR